MKHLLVCYGSLRATSFQAAARAPAALVVSVGTPEFPHDPLNATFADHFGFPMVKVTADGPELELERFETTGTAFSIPTPASFVLEWNPEEVAAMRKAVDALPDGAVVVLCGDADLFPMLNATRWLEDLVAHFLATDAHQA